MGLLSKYKNKIQRQFIKNDAKRLLALMLKYELDLYLKDKDGIIFNIESGDNLRHLISEKSYLDGSIANILNSLALSNCEVSIDIGANFGLSTMLMSRFSKKVYAFEPEIKNIKRLKHLIHVNNKTNIELIEKAVSRKNGKARFFIADASSHHSLAKAHFGQSEEQTIEVDVVCLDSFCENKCIEKIGCLKIDVEGLELEVLEGAQGLLKSRGIEKIIFEISTGVMSRLNRDPLESIKYLESFDYKIRSADGDIVSSRSPMGLLAGQDLVASLS